MKVFVVGNHFHSIEKMFKKRGHTIVKDLAEADLVQFNGGADAVSYTHLTLPTTSRV